MVRKSPKPRHTPIESITAQDINASNLELVPYTTRSDILLNIGFDGIDDFWLTQEQIADLYGVTRENVTMHIKSILDGELDESLVCKDFLLPKKYGRREGFTQMHSVKHYNIDMVLAVGYRVNSKEGIAFRKKTTEIIKERIRNKSIITSEQLSQELIVMETKIKKIFEDEIDRLCDSFDREHNNIKEILKIVVNNQNKMTATDEYGYIPRREYNEWYDDYEKRIKNKSKEKSDEWQDSEGVWHVNKSTGL